MNIQPGTGYGFTSSAYGVTLNVSGPFAPDDFSTDHPFRVFNAGTATVGGTAEYYFYCTAGTVNNLDPLMSDVGGTAKLMTDLPRPKAKWDFNSTTNYSYVYLDVGVDSTDPTEYPETDDTNARYPLVGSTDVQLSSDDDFGKLLLASAYKDPSTNAITIWQYVTGSIWTDRIKMAGLTARYFWARV